MQSGYRSRHATHKENDMGKTLNEYDAFMWEDVKAGDSAQEALTRASVGWSGKNEFPIKIEDVKSSNTDACHRIHFSSYSHFFWYSDRIMTAIF